MPSLTKNRKRPSKSSNWRYTLDICLAIFLFAGSAAHTTAQLRRSPAPSPAKAHTTAPIDPLGRETPRSAMMGFLKYEERQDFATAARYLQPTPGQDTDLAQIAKELQGLHSRFKGNLALLSDDPNGTVEVGLPPGQVRAGLLTVSGTAVDVILVRVDDPDSGKIWLISNQTVASISELYARWVSEGPTLAERIMPSAWAGRRLLGMSLAQWLGWLLSIPMSWLLAWVLAFLLTAPKRVWGRLRKRSLQTVLETPLGMPLRCIVAILTHSLFVYMLGLPLLYRFYYFHFMGALLVVCLAWLVSRITDRGFDHAVNRARSQQRGGESILVLMQRLTRVVLLLIALVGALALFGVNVTTAIAGLGIGGLAIALAAQKDGRLGRVHCHSPRRQTDRHEYEPHRVPLH